MTIGHWGAKHQPSGPSEEALRAREAVRALALARAEQTKQAKAHATRATTRASLWRHMRRQNHFADAIYGTIRNP